MSDLARLETQVDWPVLRVTISGEVDASNATALEQRIDAAAGDLTALVVDLTGVTFLDSAGVRLLDHLVAAREPEPPVRVVVAPSGPVRFTLRLCGFPDALLAASAETATSVLSDGA
jgi:anti-sigma B factor antagonist